MKIALQTGAKLVPVIGFGENDLYDMRETVPGSFRAKLQRFLKTYLGFTLPNAVGRSLFLGKQQTLSCTIRQLSSRFCCAVGLTGQPWNSLNAMHGISFVADECRVECRVDGCFSVPITSPLTV